MYLYAWKLSVQNPYEGPYKVVEKNNKSFKVSTGGGMRTISLDLNGHS